MILADYPYKFRSNQPNDDAADRTDAENWREHLGNNRWRQTKQYPDGETDQPSRTRYVDKDDHKTDGESVEECSEQRRASIWKGHRQHLDSTVSAPNTRPQRFAKAKRDIFSSMECLMPETSQFQRSTITGSVSAKIAFAFDFQEK